MKMKHFPTVIYFYLAKEKSTTLIFFNSQEQNSFSPCMSKKVLWAPKNVKNWIMHFQEVILLSHILLRMTNWKIYTFLKATILTLLSHKVKKKMKQKYQMMLRENLQLSN
jgi:hypothetical protein